MALETEGVARLRECCGGLDERVKVEKLFRLLQGEEIGGVSTFELLSSGAVRQLVAHLTGRVWGEALHRGFCQQGAPGR